MKTIDLDETEIETVVETDGVVVDEDGPKKSAAGSDEVVDEDIDPLERLPASAVVNADGSVTLPLKFPQELRIRKGGKERVEKFAELRFYRLNGADQRAIQAATDEMTNVVAFSRSTRTRQAVMNVLFDRLDLFDISEGARVLASFLPNGLRTGR